MPKIHSAATLTKAYNARYAQSGTVDLAASGDKVATPAGVVPSIEAAVHSFSAPGKLVYVKATDHFLVLGETVKAGEFVELPENDAKYLVNLGRAELATDADVAAAQKAGK